MIVRITAMDTHRQSFIPNVETLAHFDAKLGDEISVHDCVLVRSERGLYVYPPLGRSKKGLPVRWAADGEIATALLDRASAMFAEMSGEEL